MTATARPAVVLVSGGMDSAVVLARNSSSAVNSASTGTGSSRTGTSSSAASSSTTARVMPGRMPCVSGCVRSAPSTTAKIVVCAPSVTMPSRTSTASKAPAAAAACLASTFGSRLIDFTSHRPQR